MPMATRMFLFSKDTGRFLARLENQTRGNPSEWKRLAAWINKKRWECCLHSSNATNCSCIHLSAEECCFHITNKKKNTNCKQEPQVEMGISVLNSSQAGAAVPAIFNYLHGFLGTIFQTKHMEICDVLQSKSFCMLQLFQENSSINFSREMNGKFQLKWDVQRLFCARYKMKHKWKHRKLTARPRHWGR